MAFRDHRNFLPAKAASAINEGQVVKLDVGDTQRQVVPVATIGDEPFGVAFASAANPGDALTITDPNAGNTIAVKAAASLGAGANIGVVGATSSLGLVAAAAGSVVWSVGKSLTAAAAGETFSLYVRPRQISGTP